MFQANAFQHNAFQVPVAAVEPPRHGMVVSGAAVVIGPSRRVRRRERSRVVLEAPAPAYFDDEDELVILGLN